MKESIKMENYDGFLDKMLPMHQTKIIPLRWFANFCERPANYHLSMYLHHSDHDNYGLACRLHAYLSNILYKPYLKWGTTYVIDTNELNRIYYKDE